MTLHGCMMRFNTLYKANLAQDKLETKDKIFGLASICMTAAVNSNFTDDILVKSTF